MNIVLASIDTIAPYDKNPRKNQDAIKKVAASIKEFGFQQPIVVDPEYVVIAGHTRLLAARSLGLATVPIVVADKLTSAQVKAYRLADNRTHEEANWDYELLKIELSDLENMGYDLTATGFDGKELDKLINPDAHAVLNAPEYEQKFEVVVTCEDEADQKAVYKLLTSKGYECRVLSM